MAGRPPKEATRLPTWEIRLQAWAFQLKREFCLSQEITDMGAVRDIDLYNFVHNRLPLSTRDKKQNFCDPTTFSRWLKRKSDPPPRNREKLCIAAPDSGQFLDPLRSRGSGLPTLLNAIDYYLCARRRSSIRLSLLDDSSLEKMVDRCLSDIAKKWKIPFVWAEEKNWKKNFPVNDVSLSMLNTHGISAIPMYLCSLASEDLLKNSVKACDWYLDLLTSTLIISGKIHREKIDIQEHYHFYTPNSFSNEHQALVGTNPNLLEFIGYLLTMKAEEAHVYMLAACKDNYFNEIENKWFLLLSILTGHNYLTNKTIQFGFYWKVISVVITEVLNYEESDTHELTRHVNPIDWETHNPFFKSCEIELDNIILYHLECNDGVSLKRQIVHKSGYISGKTNLAVKMGIWGDGSQLILRDLHDDAEFSWGYCGRGPIQTAYTILCDLFLTAKLTDEPSMNQCELIVFRLLIRFHNNNSYTISSEQLISALKEPTYSFEESKNMLPPWLKRMLAAEGV